MIQRRMGMIRLIISAMLVVGASGPPLGAEAPPPAVATVHPSPPNIILITIDTLRADHLGCYGYFRDTSPNIDAIAAESIVFDRAMTPMATTFPAHVSLLTAVYPQEHGYLSNTRLLDTSFVSCPPLRSATELLKNAGYATAAFVSAAPVRDSTVLGAGFDTYDQPERDDWKAAGTRRAGETCAAFLSWLDGRPKQPFLAWIHLFDPHWPYDPPPPYDTTFKTDARLNALLARRKVTDTFPQKWKDRTASDVHNLYDGEIRYLDDALGRVFDRLRTRGLLERSILVITADHGEGLGQHTWPAHGQIHAEQLHIPLMVRCPKTLGVRPRRVSRVVSLVDVVPTVLALAGPPLRGLMDNQATGRDVLADGFDRQAVFSERTDRRDNWDPGRRYALTTPRWRYYHLTQRPDELYDLRADPFELHNVIEDHPALAKQMRGRIVSWLQTAQSRRERIERVRPAPTSPPDPAIKRHLGSLGYLEGNDSHGGEGNDNDGGS